MTVSLDTNWDPDDAWAAGLWDLLQYVDVFLPNEQEAIRMTGASGLDEAIDVLSRRVPVLAVKMGERGAMACIRGCTAHQPALRVPVVDTVGAGDSFDAGFAYGFLRGLSAQDCLKIGCFCGARNVSAGGGISGQATADEIGKIL
jgi:sugar/nucleoside kinase (ribokinase family)